MTINITPAELAALIRNLQRSGPVWKAEDLPAAKREELKMMKQAREEENT